jgi:3-hydroxymyristoyl/3-hydroxydecanoyl-(acyl carrier protein) dehydratase
MFELVRRIRIVGERATGVAVIAADHPGLADHFPGRPILPGTWLVELAAQIAGPLAEAVVTARHRATRYAVLAMIRDAKLAVPVALPAEVRIEATLGKVDLSAVTAAVTAYHGDAVALRAELVLAMIDAPPDAAVALRARDERLARWKAAP